MPSKEKGENYMSTNAHNLLSYLLKEYSDKVKNIEFKNESIDLGSSCDIREKYFKNLSEEEVIDIMNELCQLGFLNNIYASGVIYECELTELALSLLNKK